MNATATRLKGVRGCAQCIRFARLRGIERTEMGNASVKFTKHQTAEYHQRLLDAKAVAEETARLWAEHLEGHPPPAEPSKPPAPKVDGPARVLEATRATVFTLRIQNGPIRDAPNAKGKKYQVEVATVTHAGEEVSAILEGRIFNRNGALGGHRIAGEPIAPVPPWLRKLLPPD